MKGLTREDMYRIFCSWSYREWDREKHYPRAMIVFSGGYCKKFAAVKGKEKTISAIPNTVEDIKTLIFDRYGEKIEDITKVEFLCGNNRVYFRF